jgi:hypothetical protein
MTEVGESTTAPPAAGAAERGAGLAWPWMAEHKDDRGRPCPRWRRLELDTHGNVGDGTEVRGHNGSQPG